MFDWCEFTWVEDGVTYRCALLSNHVHDPETQEHVSGDGSVYNH